jgi:hypothetical protein
VLDSCRAQWYARPCRWPRSGAHRQ